MGRPLHKLHAPESSCKTVCVVGAGVSGLVSVRELLREGHQVTIIEQRDGIGRQWLYDDGHGVQSSSIYASLRLIAPREAMGFSDFPFYAKVVSDGDSRRFPSHREFLSGVTETEETFDAVVVANGHYSQPKLPAIDGMDTWRRQLHNQSYRVPDLFRDEVVVVVGCQESGKDIGLELTKVAHEVHLRINRPAVEAAEGIMGAGLGKALAKHANLYLHPQIDRLQADGRVVFADGSCVVADMVIYCMGYS
ncbi:hypothetical protein QYE76_036558 [Lolium multiflorum]|uniref:FAD/NAD(P)-binding domain-containing protein n=1 Tax=Lolium multiflorum TaxID=4521 RepID=A0AAD8R150_LOLMU|nr:hypothetical protein QYE76_036558 [Lolium multiflorum]